MKNKRHLDCSPTLDPFDSGGGGKVAGRRLAHCDPATLANRPRQSESLSLYGHLPHLAGDDRGSTREPARCFM